MSELKCIKCGGNTIKSVDSGLLSAKAIYSDYYISSETDKFVCLDCGYIEEYVRNPKVFTDINIKKWIWKSVQKKNEYW